MKEKPEIVEQPLRSKLKLAPQEEEKGEEEKEVDKFLKGGMTFKLISAVDRFGENNRKRSNSQSEKEATVETLARSDSTDQIIPKETSASHIKILKKAFNPIKSFIYTNEAEGLLHEYKVNLCCLYFYSSFVEKAWYYVQ